MRLIKPSYEVWKQSSGFEGMLEHIERAGRVCYKSEGNIKYDECGNSLTAEPFVQKMIKSSHGAMLEHSTVYLKLTGVFLDPTDCDVKYGNYVVNHYADNKYSKVVIKHDKEWKSNVYVTTNYRVVVENGWLDDLKYLCEPTEYHEKRVTVKFILSRSIAQEYTRHRVFSFAMESQRYCAYNKDKFGNEVTFIIPCWTNLPEQEYGDRVNPKVFNRGNTNGIETNYVDSLRQAEYNYFNLLNQGWKPQQAREVLPNACKTELVMTGFVSDWKHFFELRCASNAHPQAQELAKPLHEEFIKNDWL